MHGISTVRCTRASFTIPTCPVCRGPKHKSHLITEVNYELQNVSNMVEVQLR